MHHHEENQILFHVEKGEVRCEKFQVKRSWHSIWQRPEKHRHCPKNCQRWKSREENEASKKPQPNPRGKNCHCHRQPSHPSTTPSSSRLQFRYMSSITQTNSPPKWKPSRNFLRPPHFHEIRTSQGQASGENNAQILPSLSKVEEGRFPGVGLPGVGLTELMNWNKSME